MILQIVLVLGSVFGGYLAVRQFIKNGMIELNLHGKAVEQQLIEQHNKSVQQIEELKLNTQKAMQDELKEHLELIKVIKGENDDKAN